MRQGKIMVERSRIPRFYRMSIDERVRAVHERGLISDTDMALLTSGRHTLDLGSADKMIENVIGVMGMPIGLGLNFLINGRDYVVPLVVEEPSIVAALSGAAKLARNTGGFETRSTDPVLTGQIQIVDVPDIDAAVNAIESHRDDILGLANTLHPRMVARGGGAKDLDVRHVTLEESGEETLVLHLHVDTRDAMGANLVNGMCEAVASLVETVTEGTVFLRILSNLTDRALAWAEVAFTVEDLAGNGYSGERVRDGIVIASQFAAADPYRAATHNKGIMNGVDAVALATGNDWRAIEAGAHAWAARSGRYSALTRWWTDEENGNLCGRIEVPVKVGIVGGPLESNPSVAMNLRMMGVESATELAEVMAAVGLAQNFAALRALATDGIQKGHMTLHARSVVKAAGAPPDLFDQVLEQVVRSGEIKVWNARRILDDLSNDTAGGSAGISPDDDRIGVGYGKVILIGEHAVVHGRHALAVPIPATVRALVEDCDAGVHLHIPRWGLEYQLDKPRDKRRSFEKAAGAILDELGLASVGMRIEVFPDVPRGMGLGGSAALAVAIVRALDRHFGLDLDDDQVNSLAFLSEKVAHGEPSGLVEPLNLQAPLELVIGMTSKPGLTASTVRMVHEARDRQPALYERIFDDIDHLALQSVAAIQDGDLGLLGEYMNICHGLLNALQLSTPDLEQAVLAAREAGALGAKLTGGGGGGAMVALCDGNMPEVARALTLAGCETLSFASPPGGDT
jgi:hydroxymethylglutaryl-CoA reductase